MRNFSFVKPRCVVRVGEAVDWESFLLDAEVEMFE